MKAEEKAEQARIRAEERAADHEFAEMIRRKELAQQEKTERQSVNRDDRMVNSAPNACSG